MSHREKTQADVDLERVVELFDRALTSKDERVVNALRSLLMIVALTDPDMPDQDLRIGPFRQLQEELEQLRRNVINIQMEVSQLRNPSKQTNPWAQPGDTANPYTNPGSPYYPTWTGTPPNTGLGWTSSQTTGIFKEEEK